MTAISIKGVAYYKILHGYGNCENISKYLIELRDALVIQEIANPLIIINATNFHRMDIIRDEMAILGPLLILLKGYSLNGKSVLENKTPRIK